MINPSRRSLIIGIGASLIGAPAIVRASSLMQVKVLKPSIDPIVAAELAKREILWLPQAIGYADGDIVHLTPPSHWAAKDGLWRVIKHYDMDATKGAILERIA